MSTSFMPLNIHGTANGANLQTFCWHSSPGCDCHMALTMTQKYSSASSERSLAVRLILSWRWFQMIQRSICQIPLCTVIRNLAENFWHERVTNSWRWWWGKGSYNPHVMRKPHISTSDCFLRAEVFNKQDLTRERYNKKFLQQYLPRDHKMTA